MGEVGLVDGILVVDRAHVDGLEPGRLRRSGLNAIGLKILEGTGAHSLDLQGSTRTTGRNPGRPPRLIRFPRPAPARDDGPIHKPVSVAKLIAHLGTSLRRGHGTLDRIVTGEAVPVELIVPDGRDVVAEFADLNIRAQVIARPSVDIAGVREHLALTQAELAIRFGLELDTVRNWEQGRYTPDPAAMILLEIIAQNPAAVDAALAAPSDQLAAE